MEVKQPNRLESVVILMSLIAACVAPWHIIETETLVQWVTLMVLDLSWGLMALVLIMRLYHRMVK